MKIVGIFLTIKYINNINKYYKKINVGLRIDWKDVYSQPKAVQVIFDSKIQTLFKLKPNEVFPFFLIYKIFTINHLIKNISFVLS